MSILLSKIRTVVPPLVWSPLNSTISTATNSQKVIHNVVLVGDLISKFVLVQLTLCITQLIRVSHSMDFFQVPKIGY